MLEKNKIYLGDCLQVMKDIADKSIDAIICDLPYGTTACKWDVVIPFVSLWHEYNRICDGAIVLTASQPFTSRLIISNLDMFKYELIWHKDKPTNFALANKQPMKYHENICVFYAKQPTYNKQKIPRTGSGSARYKTGVNHNNRKKHGIDEVYASTGIDYYSQTEKNPSSILYFNTGRRQDLTHPTQKPVALFEYLIRTYTNEGDTVLDNCIGSGTTAVACINTKRNFIGIEKEEKYYDIANKRIKDTLEQQTTAVTRH